MSKRRTLKRIYRAHRKRVKIIKIQTLERKIAKFWTENIIKKNYLQRNPFLDLIDDKEECFGGTVRINEIPVLEN